MTYLADEWTLFHASGRIHAQTLIVRRLALSRSRIGAGGNGADILSEARPSIFRIHLSRCLRPHFTLDVGHAHDLCTFITSVNVHQLRCCDMPCAQSLP